MGKKILIPEGMLQAGRAVYSGYVTAEVGARRILEAALRWLAENPQHPTDYEFGEIVNACRDSIGAEAWEKGTEWMRAGMLCHEWQRRMFVDRVDYYRRTPDGGYVKMDGPMDTTPELKVEDEVAVLADNLYETTMHQRREVARGSMEQFLAEAYHRGQKSKETAK